MCFTVDHRLLFVDLTEEAIEDGFLFYATFYEAPPAIKVCDMIFCVLYNDMIPPFFVPLRRAESEGRCLLILRLRLRSLVFFFLNHEMEHLVSRGLLPPYSSDGKCKQLKNVNVHIDTKKRPFYIRWLALDLQV